MKKILFASLMLLCCMSIAKAQKTGDSGFTLGVETGLLQGTGPIELNGYSFGSLTAGYTFNNNIFVGGNLGFRKYYGTLLIPIAARVKWTPLNTVVSPYVLCDVGYNLLGGTTKYDIPANGTIPYNPKVMHGFLLEPELGIALRVSKSSQFSIGAGFYGQTGEFERDYIENGDMVSEVHDGIGVVTVNVGYTYTF